MNKIFKYLFFRLVVFSAYFIGIFVLIFSFCVALNEFDLIDVKIAVVFPLMFSIFLSVIFLYCETHIDDDHKIKKWRERNISKLGLSYIVIVAFLLSIKSKVIWTDDEMKEIISFQWTILGTSIAIFLTWHVIFSKFLEKNNPQLPNEISLWDYRDYIKNKRIFWIDINNRFFAVVYLTINLVLMMALSSNIYILKNGQCLIVQIVTLFNMYFSTNTLFLLFIDILTPVIKEKNLMRNKAKPTKDEEELEKSIDKLTYQVISKIIEIEKDESLDLLERQKKVDEELKSLTEKKIKKDK